MKRTITLLSLILLLSSSNFAQDRFVFTDAWGFGFGFTYPMYISINDAQLKYKRILWWTSLHPEKFFGKCCLETKRRL